MNSLSTSDCNFTVVFKETESLVARAMVLTRKRRHLGRKEKAGEGPLFKGLQESPIQRCGT